MISNHTHAALGHLPRYVPEHIDSRELRNLLEDMITAVRMVAEDQQSIQLLVAQAVEQIDVQWAVDQAISETAMASELSDLTMEYVQMGVELRELQKVVGEMTELHRGPEGPKGVAGPPGVMGPAGRSGVESPEFVGFIERMKDMEDRMAEIASAVDELEGK